MQDCNVEKQHKSDGNQHLSVLLQHDLGGELCGDSFLLHGIHLFISSHHDSHETAYKVQESACWCEYLNK
jgi:hypothetical protein